MIETKIIGLLYCNQGRDFTINEIAKQLKVAYSFVNRIVNRLVQDKTIKTRRIGNACACSFDSKNDMAIAMAYLSEVQNKEELYKKNSQMKFMLEEFSGRVRSKYNEEIISIALFGSYVKGNAAKDSDVDLLVICKKKINVSRIAHDVSAIYGKEINAMTFTMEEIIKQKDKPVIIEIAKNHITCLGFREFSDMINSFSEK